MGRSAILIRNVIYNFFSQVWFVLLGFFVTPYLLKKIGTDAYGLLSLINVVVGYTLFFDWGIGSAIVKNVAEANGQNDHLTVRNIFSVSLFIYLILGIAGMFLLWIFTPLFVDRILKIPAALHPAAIFIFYVGALILFFNFIVGPFEAILVALQRFDLLNQIKIIFSSASFLGMALLVYFGFWLRSLIILNLLVVVTTLIVYGVVLKKTSPFIRLRPVFNFNLFVKLSKFGGNIFLGTIANKTIFQLDKLLISIFLPVAKLSYYVIPFNLSERLQLVSRNIASVTLPSVSELYGQSSLSTLRELYLKASKFVLIGTIPFFVLGEIFAGDFLKLWINPGFAEQAALPFKIFIGSFFLVGTMAIPSGLIIGIGRPQLYRNFSVGAAVLSLILWPILIPKFSLIGAALPLFIAHLIFSPLYLVFANSILEIRWKFFLKRIFLKPSIFGLILFFTVLPFRKLATGMPLLITLSLIFFGLYFIFSFFLLLDEKDRNLIKEYFKK